MTPLQRAESLLEKITPNKWKYFDRLKNNETSIIEIECTANDWDIEFISSAPALMRELIQQNKELTQQIKELKADADRWIEFTKGKEEIKQ